MDAKLDVLAIDVDGVVADLHPVWLARYNKDYNDNMTVEDWTEWNIENLVKPECGQKIFEYIREPNIYDEVKPIEGALEKIQDLKNYHRIIYVTSSEPSVSGRKYYWLKEHGFVKNRMDYVEALDKTLICARYLIDDDFYNVKNFTHGSNRFGILFDQIWNRGQSWKYRIKGWKDFYPYTNYIARGGN